MGCHFLQPTLDLWHFWMGGSFTSQRKPTVFLLGRRLQFSGQRCRFCPCMEELQADMSMGKGNNEQGTPDVTIRSVLFVDGLLSVRNNMTEDFKHNSVTIFQGSDVRSRKRNRALTFQSLTGLNEVLKEIRWNVTPSKRKGWLWHAYSSTEWLRCWLASAAGATRARHDLARWLAECSNGIKASTSWGHSRGKGVLQSREELFWI